MDISKIVADAQKMQKKIEKKQEELEKSEFLFESNGGAIKIKMKGNKKIVSLEIENDLFKGDNKSLLQEMLIIAINEATSSIQQEMDKLISSFGNNINLPGVF